MNSNIVEVEFVRKNGKISVAGLSHSVSPSIIVAHQSAHAVVEINSPVLALTRFTNFQEE